MFCYTVRCQFQSDDPELVSRWLQWLTPGHIQDVVDAGATQGVVVKMDADTPTYEIRYQFPSRNDFHAYEENHAPRLREEGLEKFPLSLGLSYTRTTGETLQ